MERRLRRPRRDETAAAPLVSTQPSLLPVTRRAGSLAAAAASGPATRTRVSPSRNRAVQPTPEVEVGPRTRRSSRPRSSIGPIPSSLPVKTSVKSPTPIREVPEVSTPVRQATSNLPMTLTTNTASRAPNKSFNTSSVNSNAVNTYSSSSTVTEHIEIRTEGEGQVDIDAIRKRITERLRRSVSKTLSNLGGSKATNTEDGSRYSRSLSRSVYEDEKSSKQSYSTGEEDLYEEDELEEEDEFRSFNATLQSANLGETSCRQMKSPEEFGGRLGALLLLLLVPFCVYYLTWSCAVRNSCQFKNVNLSVLLDWDYLARQVFQIRVVGSFVAYQVAVFLLVALLPGRRVHLTRETYTFNSLAVALVLISAGGYAEYKKYPVVSYILRHYLRFCIFGIVSAFVAAAWSYWRVDTAKYNVLRHNVSNEYGRTGSFVVDFALGRQLNPKWMGRVDWKQYYYRLSLISTLLYATCYIYQTLQWPKPHPMTDGITLARYYLKNTHYDPGTLLSASCLLLYVLDAIVFEHHLSSSFELQYEGYGGILLLRYATTPYLLTAVTKYFYDQRVPITCWYAPIGVVALLLLGLCVKRFSSAYKYQYRLNSQNPIFANIETIHTFQGNRILLTGLWGHVRQPNYLGDIIALVALATPMALRLAWPPVLGLGLLVLVLLHRTTRSNARNHARYHSAWNRYCARVRYSILPRVF